MDDMTYQRMLRVLGASFDQAHAEEIRIMELNGTVAIQHRATSEQAPTGYQLISRERLLELEKEQIEEREGGMPAGKYQDILRTVGWELDQVGARGIWLDEHEEGMLVSFHFLKASDGLLPHKTAWHVTGDQRQVFLDRAHGRRHIEPPVQKRRLRDFFA